MSCRPEPVLSAYVDGGLAAAESRALEAHLVGCQRCRRNVVALREEAALLAAALCGKLPRDSARAVVAGPARALWTGLPLCLAAALAATGVLSFLFEARLPAGFGWLHPVRLLGVNDMLWNFFGLLRNEASGWLQLAVGLGALASLAAMGSFLAGALLRRVAGTAALVLLLCAGAAGIAAPAWAAAEFRMSGAGHRIDSAHGIQHLEKEESDHIRLEVGERIEGGLFAAGESITLEGDVDGDVFAFAERIVIRGAVSGNVIAAAENIELSGVVSGSVFAAAEHLELSGVMQRSVHAAGRDIRIAEAGRVGRDVSAAAERLRVDGTVARDLNAAANRLQIAGELGRDLSAAADDISVLSGARVGGGISVLLEEADALHIAPGARVAGEVRSRVREEITPAPFERYAKWRFYLWKAVWLGAAFVLGLVLYALLPGLFRIGIRSGGDFGSSLLLGFASFVVTPIACVILAVTWIGIPVALLGAGLFGALWYLSNLVLAVLIGRWLLRRDAMQQSEDLLEFGLALLAGLLVWTVLRSLPFAGVPFRLVLVPLGMGLLIRHGYAHWRASRGVAPAPSY